jgi:RNA polymerase sigma-70 factor (ECF subfamily)
MQTLEIEARFNSILEDYDELLRHSIASQFPRNIGLSYDDIVQEAHLRLWRALSGEREIHNVPSYLYRIAATVTIDAVRRVNARREEQMDFGARPNGEPGKQHERPELADERPSPETVAVTKGLMEIVNEALSHLPENRRRAVGLHLQGWNIPEIAALMGWSDAKAKNLTYRGLDELRRQLRHHGIDYEVE